MILLVSYFTFNSLAVTVFSLQDHCSIENIFLENDIFYEKLPKNENDQKKPIFNLLWAINWHSDSELCKTITSQTKSTNNKGKGKKKKTKNTIVTSHHYFVILLFAMKLYCTWVIEIRLCPFRHPCSVLFCSLLFNFFTKCQIFVCFCLFLEMVFAFFFPQWHSIWNNNRKK